MEQAIQVYVYLAIESVCCLQSVESFLLFMFYMIQPYCVVFVAYTGPHYAIVFC